MTQSHHYQTTAVALQPTTRANMCSQSVSQSIFSLYRGSVVGCFCFFFVFCFWQILVEWAYMGRKQQRGLCIMYYSGRKRERVGLKVRSNSKKRRWVKSQSHSQVQIPVEEKISKWQLSITTVWTKFVCACVCARVYVCVCYLSALLGFTDSSMSQLLNWK